MIESERRGEIEDMGWTTNEMIQVEGRDESSEEMDEGNGPGERSGRRSEEVIHRFVPA